MLKFAFVWMRVLLPLLTVLGRYICLWRGYLSYDVIGGVSSARTEIKAGWFGCVCSVPVLDMWMQLAMDYITLIITLSFSKTWAEREISFNTEGRWQLNWVDSKCWSIFLWTNCKIGKKPHANVVRHMLNQLQTLYSLHLCSAFEYKSTPRLYDHPNAVPGLFPYGTLCCQGFYFRMNCALSLLLNVFPHVENWEFDWKAELPSFWLSEEMKQKQTGRLKLRSSVTSWRQLRSVWILLSLLLPGISIEIKVLLHWLFHILAMVLPLELVVSWMTMIVIYHWQLVSLQFYACDFYVSMVTWNILAGADGFGKFNFDGADELCNSTHMSELTGSWGTFIFQHSIPLFLCWCLFYRKLLYHSSAFSSCWCSWMGKN